MTITRHTTGPFVGNGVDALAPRLRDGSTTATALLGSAIDAIDEHNAALNAFSYVDHDGAFAAAEQADRELGDGRDRGPLHGVPVAVKDIIDVAGMATTSGSALYLDRVASADAACVSALRAAGAVIVGKTVLHELAFGATGDRSVHGPSRNPHDPARISGGSSGGSAVAVAAGMVPLALGTDTAGSVRVPAALCGIVGVKPAFDELPPTGVYALAPSLDHLGVFATTVRGAALAWAALAPDAQRMPPTSRVDALRVGWVPPDGIGPVDPLVEAQVRRALEAVIGPVDDVALTAAPGELFAQFSILQSSEAAAIHADVLDVAEESIDADVFSRLARGAQVPAWTYLQAVERRDAFRAEVGGLLNAYDLLALPTVPTIAADIGTRELDIGGAAVDLRAALLSLTSPWNLTGSPAVSVPAGTVDGLPVGLQLVSAPGREPDLLAVAETAERYVTEMTDN